jgi:hypothetical protein
MYFQQPQNTDFWPSSKNRLLIISRIYISLDIIPRNFFIEGRYFFVVLRKQQLNTTRKTVSFHENFACMFRLVNGVLFRLVFSSEQGLVVVERVLMATSFDVVLQ